MIALRWLKGRIGDDLNDLGAVVELYESICELCGKIKLTATWVSRDHNLAGVFIEEHPQPVDAA